MSRFRITKHAILRWKQRAGGNLKSLLVAIEKVIRPNRVEQEIIEHTFYIKKPGVYYLFDVNKEWVFVLCKMARGDQLITVLSFKILVLRFKNKMR